MIDGLHRQRNEVVMRASASAGNMQATDGYYYNTRQVNLLGHWRPDRACNRSVPALEDLTSKTKEPFTFYTLLQHMSVLSKLPQKLSSPFALLGDEAKLAFRSQPSGIAKLASTRVRLFQCTNGRDVLKTRLNHAESSGE